MKSDMINFCEYLTYRKESLFLDDVKLSKIPSRFSTPIYCYSVRQIKDNFKILKDTFKKMNPLICYALKANFNPKIVQTLSKLGAGMDVVSGGELRLSNECGVDKNKIVFSGVGKTEDEINFAISHQIKQINVESVEELEEIDAICNSLNKKMDISLRVNPNVDAQTLEKISTGRSEDKFGIPESDILEMFRRFKKNKYLNINGLSIHIGSQIKSLKPFEQAFHKIKILILQIRKEGFNCDILDVGGGIAIQYNLDDTTSFTISDYVRAVEKYFSKLEINLILEPGRYLVGQSGILLSKVVRVKKGKEKDFLIIDAGMNNLIRPSLYNAQHSILALERTKKKVIYDVVGPICETSDIFQKNAKLEQMKKNDLLAICSTGAYSSCMSSDYNLRGIAKEILIDGKKILET